MSAPQVRLQIGKYQFGKGGVMAARLVLLASIVWIGYLAPPWRYWPMWLAAGAWIGFSIYWGAEKKAADAKTWESAESRRVHVILSNIGLFLFFLPLPGLRQAFLPPSPVWIPLGLGILAASIGLAVWARRHLGRNWSGRIEIKVDHELIRSGPYRLLRHPIYTAMLGMCAGTAIVDGHVHALAGVAVFVAAYWRKVRMEEANMRNAFGARYDAYRRATWGAIPGLF